MAQGKEKKYFAQLGEHSAGINSDDAPFAIDVNETVNMQNVRFGSTDKGFTGILESIGGTLLISTPSPSVSFIELGNTVDVVGNRDIYAYYNTTTSQHKIEVFDKNSGIIYLALLSSQVTGGLNFDKNHPIDGRVVNGIWYFNDNYNPPRKLNIDAAIKMNNSSYSTTQTAYTNPLEASVITLIRRPSPYPPSVSKQVAGGIRVNNVADFSGQFAIMYDFRDNERCVLSPPSKLINYNTESDTFNEVAIVMTDTTGTVFHIPQDVQIVNFCVKPSGSPIYFIIRSWDKRIAADATAIVSHNNGITPLNYNFLNDHTGIALDSAYSVNPFDSVPLLCQTLEIGENRLMLSNDLEAYNSPILSSLVLTPVPETNTVWQNPAFHSGSSYQFGILFRDGNKRVVGNVFTNSSMLIQIPDRNYNNSTYYHVITWALSNAAAANEIPVDAEFYDIVATKNLRTRFFVQAKSGGMQYAIKDPISGVISYQDTYTSAAYGLAFNASLLNAVGMGYEFDPLSGDIIKIWLNLSATIYSLAVIAQDGNYIISKLQDLGSFAIQPNILFEIYTPYKPSTNEPFFTVGETFAINNAGTNSRTYSTISGNIYGDIYTFGVSAPSGSYVAENMSPIAKYWKEWNVNAGEFNLALPSLQVRKPTAIRWSNTFIEGSNTNGLSTFDALDERILPLSLGSVQKLQETSKVEEQGNIMLAIGEAAVASLYLGEVQVIGSDQNAFLASSPAVIGTINILKGDFGTTMPTSVVEYRGTVFFYDLNAGRWIQYASNGLFPISNYKMTRFWKLWATQFKSLTSTQIEALGSRPFIFTTVDPAHDELLISIPKLAAVPPKGYLRNYSDTTIDAGVQVIYPFDILDFDSKTMVYDLKANRWTGSYSFTPEGFAVLQNQLYSFKNGQMYIHNQFRNQCKFYGVQYKARVMPISNMAQSTPKVYNAMAVEANYQPTYVMVYNDYPYEQESDLVDYDFRSLEGVWNATFYRNILTPTATGFVPTGRLTAEKMRGVYMYFMLEFSPTGSNVMQLKFLDLAFSLSIGNVNV